MRRGKSSISRKLPSRQKKTWAVLPGLVLQKIALLSTCSIKDLLTICSVSKAWRSSILQSQLVWLHLSLCCYPEKVSRISEAQLMYTHESSGGVDWKSLFISSHKHNAALVQKLAKKQVLKLLQSNSLSLALYKSTAAKLTLRVKVGKAIELKTSKDIFLMDNSLCARHILQTSSNTIPPLAVSLSSLKIELPSSTSRLLVAGEEFNLLQNDHCLVVCFTSGEIVFVAWNLHYVYLLSNLVKYRPMPRYSDHDSLFGLLGYYVIVEVRTGGTSMARTCFRSIDFEPSGEYVEAVINTSTEGMKLKADFGFAWQSTAFSNKFKDVAVFDITVKATEGEPIWGISQAALLQRDSLDPNEATFSVSDAIGIASFAIKKFTIRSILLKIKASFISSLFVKASPLG